MSKLEELIQKLCPNGVEYIKLGSIATEIKEKNKDRSITEVRTITNKSKLVRTSDFFDRDITSEDTSSYKVVREDMFVYNPSRINIGSIAYSTEKEPVILSPMYVVFSVPKALILNEFLILYFKSNMGMHQIVSRVEPGARFRLPFESLSKIRVPVPPMRVQHEIVRILNNFTDFTAELTTKLTAEIAARKRQFEYYRNILFEFNDSVQYIQTSDLKEDSFWLMPATPNYTERGIPYITSKNIKDDNIDFDNVAYISEEDYLSISTNRKIKENDLLITMIGTIGEAAFVKDYTEFYGQNIYLLRLDGKKINRKYYYYYLTSPFIKNSLISGKNASSQGYIKAGSIDNLKIPTPSFETQSKIAHILDSFTALMSALMAELTAELAVRNKQYEYYRDKLLTFKEKEA